MKVLDINTLKSPGGETANFQGFEHGANVSFFVVQFSPGHGPRRHRHPYEETFILLDGEIEVTAGDDTQVVGSNRITIIPANTWHEFRNHSDKPVLMVNIHPTAKMVTEWA